MKQFIESVVDSIVQSGLVEVEVSARHVHLTQEDVELLFGKGAVLHPKRPLSQPPTSVPDSAAVSAVFSIALPVLL